jgi:DHA3 family macrolide efflux protein-like MFS transporter
MQPNWKTNTALFLTGQALSFFGTMVVQYAIIWHITLKSQSGTMMALFTVAVFLPMFLVSPFAGVWADRYNRKYVINIADGAVAFASLVVAIFLIYGIDSYIILLLCAFVRAIGQGVQSPAVSAFIPQIVPDEHLTRINGFQSSIQSFVTLASPILSGALMTFAPLYALFLLDVITAAIGIGIVLFLVHVPEKENPEIQLPAKKGLTYFTDLKEGLRYIRKLGHILRLIILTAINQILIAPIVFLSALQVTRGFGADVWRLSAVQITFSVGMIIGGILIGIWGGFKNKIYTMVFACTVLGLSAAGLGVVPSFWLYVVLMALIGLAFPLYNTSVTVLIQTTVDTAFMGRVFSAFMMVSGVTTPLAMIFFGPLADKISINTLFIVTGLLMASMSIPMLASKVLRKAGMSNSQEIQDQM